MRMSPGLNVMTSLQILVVVVLCWTVTVSPGRVIDGDTFEATVRIWPGLTATERIRVLGVDTPEMKGATRPAAERARVFTAQWLQVGEPVVRTCGRDVFGRLLGRVSREGEDLAAALIDAGHGKKR